ncbi:hypothetical protein [Flavobacterium sp.]|uniref:hypothetical protein n=1 Tax=Flavobacterium sp. TaxID=239 RepID=UPI0037524C50
MKTIKSTFFSLLILIVGTSLATSCSKDDETNANVIENAKVSSYLETFYSTNFQFGKSVETNPKSNSTLLNRSTEVENLVITEVFVGNATTARGYVITDKNTNDFLYFIDVDRIDFKMTSVKIDVNQVITLDNINQLEKYFSTNEFDYIKIAQDYQAEINENQANKRPFWGWAPTTPGACGPNSNGDGGCSYGTYQQHYIFWIKDGEPVATGDVFPCNC